MRIFLSPIRTIWFITSVLTFDKSTSSPIPFPICTNIAISNRFRAALCEPCNTVALIIEAVEHYLSTNSVLFRQTLIHYCCQIEIIPPLSKVPTAKGNSDVGGDMSDASLFNFAFREGREAKR